MEGYLKAQMIKQSMELRKDEPELSPAEQYVKSAKLRWKTTNWEAVKEKAIDICAYTVFGSMIALGAVSLIGQTVSYLSQVDSRETCQTELRSLQQACSIDELLEFHRK